MKKAISYLRDININLTYTLYIEAYKICTEKYGHEVDASLSMLRYSRIKKEGFDFIFAFALYFIL